MVLGPQQQQPLLPSVDVTDKRACGLKSPRKSALGSGEISSTLPGAHIVSLNDAPMDDCESGVLSAHCERPLPES